MITRAGELLKQLVEVDLSSTGTSVGGGLISGTLGIKRWRQKRDDRVRSAGMGHTLDQAKAKKRSALIRHALNPVSRKRKHAYLAASKDLKDVRKRGHEKLNHMLKNTSATVRGEIE